MIYAVVLGAGQSKRMGRHKMLLPFGGSTVIGHIVDTLVSSSVDGTIVVVGYEAERVTAALAGRPVAIVTNPEIGSEMLQSVRAGLRAVPVEAAGVLVALGDQPRIRRELVNGMVRAFLEARGRIVVPVSRGQRGHPVLFSTEFREELARRHDDTGLRGLLEEHAREVFELDTANDAVLSDMDEPEDYRRELEAFERERRG